MSYKVIVDVSKWQNADEVPYAELKEHGVVMAMIKASMGGGIDYECSKHVAAAREAGLLIGLYHWCDPTQSWERQAWYFIEQIRKFFPDYIAYDVEQWWDSWSGWHNGTAHRLSKDTVTGNFRTVYKKVYKETQFPYDRSKAYTAKWIVDIYGNDLITALNEFPGGLWWADYTQLSLDNWKVSWETWDWLWDIWFADKEPLRNSPLDWDIWQVQSRIVVPPLHDSAKGNLDFNCVSDSFSSKLDEILGTAPTEPEVPDVPEIPDMPDGAIKKVRVTAGALNIRKGPNVNNPLAGEPLKYGTEVYIYEVNGNWGRIKPDACIWTYLGYTRDV